MDHLYSNRFTTFIENDEKTREEIFQTKGIDRYSESLWEYLNSNRENYFNKLYSEKDNRVLYPKFIQGFEFS